MATIWRAPLILRGEVIDTGEVEYGGRRGEVTFRAPAVDAHLDRLTLRNPAAYGGNARDGELSPLCNVVCGGPPWGGERVGGVFAHRPRRLKDWKRTGDGKGG